MDELSHLELRQIAERCRTRLDQIVEALTNTIQHYDGPAIVEAVGNIETVYAELGELDDPERKAERDRRLDLTRARFGLEPLRQNTPLSVLGYTSLRSTRYHSERAIEALNRWLAELQNAGECQQAISEVGNAIGTAYLIARPQM
jgi:hypothetical protein